MIALVMDHMGPLMFAGLVLFMVIGYPAAFSLAAVGLFFGFLGIEPRVAHRLARCTRSAPEKGPSG